LWFTFSFFNKLINIADQTLENTDVQNRLLGQILLIGLMFFLDLVRKTRCYFRESRRKVNFFYCFCTLWMKQVFWIVLKIEIDSTYSIGRLINFQKIRSYALETLNRFKVFWITVNNGTFVWTRFVLPKTVFVIALKWFLCLAKILWK
jgi:hypothetical protein